jgi:DNA invertase Pin-like site-specific DNA recombinase
MGRLIGYARVSTADQDLQLPLEALQHVGCRDDQIFRDVASGAHTARPGLEACMPAFAPGDTLVVWRLDRLGVHTRFIQKLSLTYYTHNLW